MSESGQLGQIEHSSRWAALKKEPFSYVSFIREDVFALDLSNLSSFEFVDKFDKYFQYTIAPRYQCFLVCWVSK